MRKNQTKNPLMSVHYAWQGLCHAFETERNFRIEVVAAVVLILLTFVLPLSAAEQTGIFLFVALVLFAELVNTSVERLVDLVSPQQHPIAGAAKDVVAGAVLIIGICAIVYTAVVAYNIIERLGLLV